MRDEEAKTVYALDLYGKRFIDAALHYPALLERACMSWEFYNQVECPFTGLEMYYALQDLMEQNRAWERDFSVDSGFEMLSEGGSSPFEDEPFDEIDLFSRKGVSLDVL